MTLAELEMGATATVKNVFGNDRISKRLMEMGVIPGVSIRMIKSAPFGDPIEIRLRGCSLALRIKEARVVEIEA